MKISNFKFQITLLAITLCISYIFPKQIKAQSAALSISPPLLQIQVDPGDSLETPMSIKNTGDDPVTLQVLFKPFMASGKENGQIQFLPDTQVFPGPNKAITSHIAVREHGKKITELTLAPGEQRNLDLYVGLPKNEVNADYYFAVVFLPPEESQTAESDSNGSSIRTGIGINLLLSVGPKGNAKGVIESFSAPSYVQSGPIPFTVRIKNVGTRYFSPTGTIIIQNMFGQKIGKVPLLSANVLPGSVRAFVSEDAFKAALKKESDDEKNGKNGTGKGQELSPVVIWPETFLIGPYTATLRVSLSEDGPELVKQVRFFAFPVQGLIAIGLVIILLLIIRKRVRQRLERS